MNPSTPFTSSSGKGGQAGSSTARVHTIRFEAPVSTAMFHPRNSKIVLAVLTCNEVVLVDLRQGGGKSIIEDVVQDEEGDDNVAERKK